MPSEGRITCPRSAHVAVAPLPDDAWVAELALFTVAFLMVDWGNHLERLLFVLAVLSYTIIALGLVALGAHVTRSVGRILAAMSAPDQG